MMNTQISSSCLHFMGRSGLAKQQIASFSSSKAIFGPQSAFKWTKVAQLPYKTLPATAFLAKGKPYLLSNNALFRIENHNEKGNWTFQPTGVQALINYPIGFYVESVNQAFVMKSRDVFYGQDMMAIDMNTMVSYGKTGTPQDTLSASLVGDKIFAFGQTWGDIMQGKELSVYKFDPKNADAPWTFVDHDGPSPSADLSSTFYSKEVGKQVYLFVNKKDKFQVYLYDTTKETFSRPEVNGDIPAYRRDSVVNSIKVNGKTKIVFFGGIKGGQNEADNDLLVFDPESATWEDAPKISGQEKPSERSKHVSLGVTDSQVIVFGGEGKGEQIVTDIYSLEADKK